MTSHLVTFLTLLSFLQQCFDASTFLMMNERKPTWVCPVCDQDGHFDLLAIDGYFEQVVEAAGPNVAEIR